MSASLLPAIRKSGLEIHAGILAGCLLIAPAFAAEQENIQQKPHVEESGQKVQEKKAKPPAKPTYYVQYRSSGLTLQSDPPRYVKQANQTWLKDQGWQDVDWLDLGVEIRARYEYINNDFRKKTETIDEPFQLRSRLYAAIKNKFDPLRATFEFQDSRRYNSQYPDTNLEVNKTEFIQGYGELYFKDALGKDDLGTNRPLSLRYGRHAFELTDKRLIARNEFRNTTNNFQGIRALLGSKNSDWQADFFAFNPIVRFMDQTDKANDAQWFYGAKFDLRKWSKIVTFQPYYYLLQQNGSKMKYASSGAFATAADKKDREIHTAGLRAYGIVADTGLDWDLNYLKQWGEDGGLNQDSYGYNMEAGYTFGNHAWKPRFMANMGYASGDANLTDQTSQRFEGLFGFARPWSHSNYIKMENIRAVKLRGEFSPTANLKIDFGYSWYDLASATDRWAASGYRDTSGKSGKEIGQEFDILARFPVTKYLSMVAGYSYFMAGDFAEAQSQKQQPGRDNDTHYVWIDAMVVAF
ncbi:alginate export family protein [Candidatus Nitrotoga fabula]|uniref:alginate export family protein n=1 Tax=Candidatus Nitrotoga fabula TaxID=2182327 RepID=UPI001BB47A87|nr:alginate export family protein [Candidatus Nitrotoga fabula]